MNVIRKSWQFAVLLCGLLGFAAVASAAGYEIRGTVTTDIDGETEVVLKDAGRNTISTAKIENNRFAFTGSVDQPQPATVSIGRRNHLIILDNDKFEVEWGVETSAATDSEYHNMVYGYLKDPAYIAAEKELAKVFAQSDKLDLTDREEVEAWQRARGRAMAPGIKIKNDYKHSILQGDYPTLVKFFVLEHNYDWDRYSLEKKLQLAQEYQKELPAYEPLADFIKGMERGIADYKKRTALSPGSKYKPVTATTVDGEQLPLADVLKDNKVVLLEFWASWCGPCRGAFPHLKRAYEEYHDKGFEIYAISLDGDHDDWVQAMEEENVPWINLVDYAEFDAKSAKDYVVNGIPASFLITGDGTFLGSDYRGWKLDDALKEYFEE